MVLSLLWDEKGGILCCIGGMAGFVVQWVVKGSCPTSRHTPSLWWSKGLRFGRTTGTHLVRC